MIGDEKEGAIGGDFHAAGVITTGGFVTDGGEFSSGVVDGKYGDAVVAAVGEVDKAACGVDEDFCGKVVFVVALGKG